MVRQLTDIYREELHPARMLAVKLADVIAALRVLKRLQMIVRLDQEITSIWLCFSCRRFLAYRDSLGYVWRGLLTPESFDDPSWGRLPHEAIIPASTHTTDLAWQTLRFSWRFCRIEEVWELVEHNTTLGQASSDGGIHVWIINEKVKCPRICIRP